MKQDIVSDLPQELASYEQIHDELPTNLKFEKGYFCVWNDRHFIHTRATLPLTDHNNGIGFGFWIEVSKSDLDKYIETESNDALYLEFECEGKLANEWPGFVNTLGTNVKVKSVSVDEKVYIVDVFVDDNTDPLLVVALKTQTADQNYINATTKLINAWVHDRKLN